MPELINSPYLIIMSNPMPELTLPYAVADFSPKNDYELGSGIPTYNGRSDFCLGLAAKPVLLRLQFLSSVLLVWKDVCT
jgi:hypothetical protein